MNDKRNLLALALVLFLTVGCGEGIKDSEDSAGSSEVTVPVTAPNFSFSPITVGDSGTTVGYDNVDWGYQGVHDAEVYVASFSDADGVLPTCVKTSFSFDWTGSAPQDCDGSNTPRYNSCVCTFNPSSTTTGECNLLLDDVCSSDGTDPTADIGDSIFITLRFNPPNNAPANTKVTKNYQWFVQDSD